MPFMHAVQQALLGGFGHFFSTNLCLPNLECCFEIVLLDKPGIV